MRVNLKIEMGVKDFYGRYSDINVDLLKSMGYEKKEHVIGRSEYDIGQEVFSDTIGGSDSLVREFLRTDEEAFRGRELNALDIHMWRGRLRFRIAKKYPTRNEQGKIIGASHVAYEIFRPSVQELNYYLALEDKGLCIYDQAKKHIQWYMNDFLKNIILNSRELQCVDLLSKGNTAKEIARHLELSHRTVEFYLDNARNKLNCVNSHELIAKCFAKGMIDISEEFLDF